MKRAAVYVRVSTEEQTTSNQLGEVEQLARSRGFEPMRYEETESAAKLRPVFERMRADVLAGKLAAVCIWTLDRFGRSQVGIMNDVLAFERAGAVVLSVRETWLNDTGPARMLLVSIFGWVAEFERTRLIERTRAGIARARRDGTESGKAIGRPRAGSPVMISSGIERVAAGRCSIEAAALAAGCSERTFRRALKARGYVFDGRGGVRPGPVTKPPPQRA